MQSISQTFKTMSVQRTNRFGYVFGLGRSARPTRNCATFNYGTKTNVFYTELNDNHNQPHKALCLPHLHDAQNHSNLLHSIA